MAGPSSSFELADFDRMFDWMFDRMLHRVCRGILDASIVPSRHEAVAVLRLVPPPPPPPALRSARCHRIYARARLPPMGDNFKKNQTYDFEVEPLDLLTGFGI